MKDLEKLLPFKEKNNFTLSLENIKKNFLKNSLDLDLIDKYYAFASFIPPGKHNTCILYNTPNEPMKNIYSFIINVYPRH